MDIQEEDVELIAESNIISNKVAEQESELEDAR